MKLFPFLGKKKYPLTVPQNQHSMTRRDIEHSVLDILGRLRRSGFQAHLVGGCVRDILLGKKPKDFDIVTNARPQQIKRLFRRCFLIGRRFRLAHVYISHDRFVEVATFRAAVDPEQVPPEGARFAANNVYGTIDEDALRRDFTVNGLYYNSADGSIIDYGGGLEDLRKKTLRSIGDPAQRFREDPVRIIRAARFCAQLGFSLSKRDHRAAIECAPLITQANAHRMLEELYKILRCGASAGTFVNLKKFGILKNWLPEIDPDRAPDLLARLAVVDRMRSEGKEIPVAVLLSALLYDLFDEAMGAKRGFQESFTMLHQRFTELVMRLRIPRKEWDSISNLVARQSSLERIPDPRKGKGFEKRFIRNAHFWNTLMFFEVRADAAGSHEAELKYWKERAARAREQEGGRPREEAGRPRKPRRRHRPQGSKPANQQN
ncbi:MAG: polynucleotide adenylyltransferase PcnB [Spirochaetes bacterium]|nr:polynucleotide adenylyltransferase PcnB [Spirochaetota bacterium]